MIIFMVGAAGYSLLEVIWRGYTHWTMAITGGICFIAIWKIAVNLPQWSMMQKCLLGAAVITAIECIVGYIVNIRLHMNVWDYSAMPFNLAGQVCLTYSVLWFLLCIPLMYFGQYLQSFFTRFP